MKKIVILGAGISGLSAAWFLQKRAKVTILEKSPRIGGWINTQCKDGFLFEEGPRGFVSRGKGKFTIQLVHDLGLDRELISANQKSKQRFLFCQGQLKPVNLSFLLKKQMISLCFREWKNKGYCVEDESIGDFFSRRFNNEIVSTLIDPMVKGIFGGDPFQLSMRACFPELLKWERDYGSLTRGFFYSQKKPSQLYSFRHGMQTLPSALVDQLKGEIYFNTTAKKIRLSDDKIVVFTESDLFEADHLIAAIPSRNLIPLLAENAPPHIDFLSLTTVNFGFSKQLLKHQGFGYLIPSQEKEQILGATWDTQIFPRNHKGTTICVMISGEQKEAKKIAQEALSRHLNIDDEPQATHVHAAINAIAQYPVGYMEKLAQFSHPRLTLLGNSYDGPGINDCIAKASMLN